LIDTDNLPEELMYLRDKPTHGVIGPSKPMSPEVFDQIIKDTVNLWQ